MMDDGGSCDKCQRYVRFDQPTCDHCLLIGNFSNKELYQILDYARGWMHNNIAEPDKSLLHKVRWSIEAYERRTIE